MSIKKIGRIIYIFIVPFKKIKKVLIAIGNYLQSDMPEEDSQGIPDYHLYRMQGDHYSSFRRFWQ